ncbi:MAG TPA: hypothetical protein PLL20_19205, partial [Phycisphaerae bacterium]|nr:hypothetical protein [Phycisphaerae bacterium]
MAFRGVRTGTEYGVAYHYDKAGTGSQLTGTGRFKRITGPGLPGYVDPSTPGYGVEYARLANSDLLEYTSYKSDADTTLARTQRDYESNRDLIEWVENKVGTTQVSKYGYTNDDLGRRTSVENSGTAFAATAFNAWGYNPKSELTSSRRYTGEYDPTPDPQAEVLAEKRLYGYDQIGNRLESTEGTASATTYGANDVNAYDWIQPPSPDPQEYFCYDEDGNLLRDGKTSPTCPGTDGLREYKWDAENRLIEVVPISPDDGDKKVKFVYDYMGRRVRKEVFIYDDGWPQENDPDEQWHFVYDGWNVVMVLDGLNSNATTRKYTWGLDLSGTIHGAGGIGGLLACEEPQAPGGPKRYWFL